MAELEAATAEAERLRGELTTANAKVDVMSNEYRTQAELLVYASEEKAKLLEVQRVLCNENGVLHPLMNKTMTGAIQGSTRTTSTTPAAVMPLTSLRAAIMTPAAAMPAAAALGMDRPGVELVEKGNEFIILNEEKIKPKLSANERYSGELWYFDTGATNHMSGNEKMFRDIDNTIKGDGAVWRWVRC